MTTGRAAASTIIRITEINGLISHKDYLDGLSMIARIIKVEVSVILQSLRLRPVTQSEGLAILSITQEPNENACLFVLIIVHTHVSAESICKHESARSKLSTRRHVSM